MAQTRKLSLHNTKVTQQNGYTVVIYHNTDVVRFNTQEIVLNFGGWDTVTTRRKMNQVSNEFNLGYSVYRVKGNTVVEYKGESFEYQGYRMLFNRDTGGFNHVSQDRNIA